MSGRRLAWVVLIGVSAAVPAQAAARKGTPPPRPQQGSARSAAQSQAVVANVTRMITQRLWDRGEYYWHNGRYTDRIATDRLVIAMDPKWIEAYGTAGWLLENTGKEQQALQMYRRATEVAPHDWETWHDLGWFHAQRKNYPEAIRLYERAVKQKGVPVFIWKNLAHIYERSGQFQKSLDTWKKVRQLDPNDGSVVNNMARVERKLKGEGTTSGESS